MRTHYTIGGMIIPVAVIEPCYRAGQYMKGEAITCECSKCKEVNAGLTQEQIRARMDEVYRKVGL